MVGIRCGVADDPCADAARSCNEGRPAVSEPSGDVQFALSEERFLDRATGRVMNANLENYKVPTVRDMPAKITVKFVNRPDRKANNLGAKGLGEPPIIPTAAAVANAVANATGARVRHAPLTRARVLEALAIAGARS